MENIPIYTLKSYPLDLQKKANALYISYSNKNLIDKNFINDYKQLQLEFKKWIDFESSNFGSKELKMHIQKDFNNEIFPNIKIYTLLVINIFGFIEYIKERKNNKNKIFINFCKFSFRSLFFYLIYKFIRAKRQ